MASSEESGSPSSSSSSTTTGMAMNGSHKKYNGVRRRKWGKWVSEIRVPGTQERLWLGSYSTPEGAAMAHDMALYCLRGAATCSSSAHKFNFPSLLPAHVRTDMSPRSVQKAASDAGMAIDAQLIINNNSNNNNNIVQHESSGFDYTSNNSISVDDYEHI